MTLIQFPPVMLTREESQFEVLWLCFFILRGYRKTYDEVRPTYHHTGPCQQAVPEVIVAFVEGNDFEVVICTEISLRGDCDTLACNAGSIAEALYGMPEEAARIYA